mmetsp:Transcript_19400/g.32429  ORF Transcript_19400/g.32429 Transcript_19400/m.32429 type:complete len:181 (+) Transcript_19400:57-599(+)|eukprot:CAMPEP_0174974550 /NCGR_PEP_ID=MMETSP0004_2-20121128/11910_1 /TAXON_ID=420556 /ORGANISM="Ochromonas sp., Strain CCMP1393" /LENGTH=180 /DNA_ID=CAMNT_0016225223 /DNA_START=48 /DNA_END=590 /DNA_ORIENTATION=+
MSQPKKAGKSSKAQRADFERVITALEKDSEAFQTPHGHLIMFAFASMLATSAPLALFTTNSIFDGKAEQRFGFYGTVACGAAVILFVTYNSLATRTRKTLLLSREAITRGERADRELKTVTGNESAYYSLFATNGLYLVLFLLFVGYLLPSQELSAGTNYLVASLASALMTGTAVSLQAL